MKRTITLSLLALAATGAMAQYRLLGETNTSLPAGNESVIYNYNSHADVVAGNWSSLDWTQFDWTSTYHSAELAYDGKFRLFGETTTTASAGHESVVYTYNTYADLIANNYSSWAMTNINWDPAFKTVGFEFDGQYRLMGETDTSASAGNESVIYTYNSFDDLIANNWSSINLTQVNWNSDFHSAGFAFDGKYRLLGETATTAGPGNESYLYTYNTFADFVAGNWSSLSATQIDWGSEFHSAGYTYQSVPEPTTIVAIGIGALAVIRKRRRK